MRNHGLLPAVIIGIVCAAVVISAGAIFIDGAEIRRAAVMAILPAAEGEKPQAEPQASPGQQQTPQQEITGHTGALSQYAVTTNNTGSELISEENRGTISTTFYGGGTSSSYFNYKNGNIRNRTDVSNETALAEIEKQLSYAIQVGSSEPQVLIYHTHATESFDRYTAGYYDKTYSTRSSDNSMNMVSVGAIVAKTLNDAGICTVQSDTQHDYQYNGSYQRSRQTIEDYLKKYPSIKVVLDLHRDGIESDGVRMRPVVDVDGVPAAQMMIIAAADSENRWNYFENLRLAARIQAQAAEIYPGLMRPVDFKYTTYNQDMSPGALLIEIGSHGNSLTEAQYSSYLLANVLIKLFAA